MHFLATHWLWFLILSVVSASIAIMLHVRLMTMVWEDPRTIGPFSGGFKSVIVATLVAHTAGILFLIGVVANLMGR